MSSKEIILSILPKTGGDVSIFGRTATPMGLFGDLIRNPRDQGWSFNTGDPEFWQFSSKLQLVVPKGKLLDIGSNLGRTSVPFALQGMNVTAYDNNPVFVKALEVIASNFDLPISVINEDVRAADFGEGKFDAVILGQVFTHFGSRDEAFDVIYKAIKALKTNGKIWFRGNGPGYDGVDGETKSFNGRNEHYMNSCDCSGEIRMEPHLFFDPAELVSRIGKRGVNIVHMQMGKMVTVPKNPKEEPKNRPNIMYGEDWDPDREYFAETVSIEDLFGGSIERPQRTDDIITIIGQKII